MSIKRVLFVPDAIIHKYEEVRSDKKLVKEFLPVKVGEVNEIQASVNMWSDNPLDRKKPEDGFLSLKKEVWTILRLIDLAKLQVSVSLCFAITSETSSKLA